MDEVDFRKSIQGRGPQDNRNVPAPATGGIRTTYGSRIYADHVPERTAPAADNLSPQAPGVLADFAPVDVAALEEDKIPVPEDRFEALLVAV